jgi:hypothetical protein
MGRFERQPAAKAIVAGDTVEGMIRHRFKVRLPVLSCASMSVAGELVVFL